MVFTRLRNQGTDHLWISFPFVPVWMENRLPDLFALFSNDFVLQLYQISFEFLNILGGRESHNQKSWLKIHDIVSFHWFKKITVRSPAQVGCMKQVLGAGTLGRPRGIRWRGRWERGLGWGIHVNPWLIHVNVWHKPLQYCKVISLQLIKLNGKKKKKQLLVFSGLHNTYILSYKWLWKIYHCSNYRYYSLAFSRTLFFLKWWMLFNWC